MTSAKIDVVLAEEREDEFVRVELGPVPRCARNLLRLRLV
jgi:hypothetical protein